MKYDSYRVFEIDMTEKEYETVRKFCQAVDDYMDYVDDYATIYEFIAAVARGRDLGHNKINIVEEKRGKENGSY